VDDKHRIEKPR